MSQEESSYETDDLMVAAPRNVCVLEILAGFKTGSFSDLLILLSL